MISIVTVCLNSAATISRTLDSVIGQSIEGFEYIIIDGASTDGTLDIIRGYEHIFKTKNIQFQLLSEKDNGIYDAMNKGIGLCRGQIIGLLNSDDFFETDSLQNVIYANVSSPDAGIYYGYLRQFLGDIELVTYRYNYDCILGSLEPGIHSAAQHPACFVKNCVYREIGKYDTSFSIAADYDFLLRAKSRGIKFATIDNIITNFSLGGISSLMSDKQRLEQRYRAQFKNGLLSEPEFQKKQRQLRYTKYKALKKQMVKWLFRTE